jgi:thiamine-phosphate pyrophosphorylase
MAFFMVAAYSGRVRRARKAIPGPWLFTDERLGGADRCDPLWRAVSALPRGGGIVFRHYGWPEAARRRLLAALVTMARRRGLILVGSRIAGSPGGVHRPRDDRRAHGRGLVTASAHGRRELLQAFAAGADLVFLSPVFPTRSHPDSATLGPLRFGLAARAAPGPVLALGGMDAQRARRLQALGAAGYGAIDAFVRAARPR